jgi:hypothetical protein
MAANQSKRESVWGGDGARHWQKKGILQIARRLMRRKKAMMQKKGAYGGGTTRRGRRIKAKGKPVWTGTAHGIGKKRGYCRLRGVLCAVKSGDEKRGDGGGSKQKREPSGTGCSIGKKGRLQIARRLMCRKKR